MNVYIIARNYIKEDCWKYLIDVLKIDTVMSFIDIDDMSDSLRNQLGRKLVRYKRYLTKNSNVQSFLKKCVVKITEGAMRFHQVNGKFEYKDMDAYVESQYNNPLRNLRDSDDKNVLIVCDMYIKEISDYLKIPVFHSVTRVLEYEDNEEYTRKYHVDASMDLALYTFNALKKYINTDKYRDRICFIRFGKDDENLFFRTKWGTPICRLKDGREIRRLFYKYVLSLLHKKYPEHFPIIEEDGKKYYTSFYDLKKIQSEYPPESDYEDENSYNDYDPYMGYGSYEKMLIAEAYEGDPSYMWNND